MDFALFDTRRYPTLPVAAGYAEWAATYESVVCDEMDLRLLERIEAICWSESDRAIDLACGTGRTGAWLKRKGVARVDGIDVTPEMLERARSRGIYGALGVADLRASDLPSAAYDLALAVLVDEHLEDLAPLYREGARLTGPDGFVVIVGYHPHFVMKGIPTHFDRANGEPVAIATHVHLLSDHVRAAHRAGLRLAELHEGIVDEAWIDKKPKWAKYRNEPISFALVWSNAAPR